jgi:hypothetical protein
MKFAFKIACFLPTFSRLSSVHPCLEVAMVHRQIYRCSLFHPMRQMKSSYKDLWNICGGSERCFDFRAAAARIEWKHAYLNTFHYYPHNILLYREAIKKWPFGNRRHSLTWSKKTFITLFISVTANTWPLQMEKCLFTVVVHKSSLTHYANDRSATYAA